MSETLAIGDLKLPIDEVLFVVEYESSRKVTEKVADGDDDATAVDGGREVRKIKVKFSWPDREDVNARAKAIPEKLDASRKDTGEPPAWAHARNGLDLGTLKNVRNVVVKKTTGPNVAPGSGINTYEVELDSQSRSSKGTAKTEDNGQKFVLASQTGKVYGTDTLTAKSGPKPGKPAVKP